MESPLPAHRQLDRVVVRAPAKLNLHLAVGALRPDGYHDLTTVYLAVSLHDELTLTRQGGGEVTVTGEGAAEVPIGEDNLAVRAVRLLAEETGHDPQVGLALRKGIPVAGGCAGGSADAAAALVGCNALWRTELTRDQLGELAGRLGSDVPFALQGGAAIGSGRGERVTSVLSRGSYAWVLALADGGLSTPAVYAELDRQRNARMHNARPRPATRLRSGDPRQPNVDPAPVLAALRSADVAALGRALSNDLQAPALALRPALGRVLEAGLELGALGALVSGSGPTVALLAKNGQHATSLAAALAGYGVCRTVRCADGPVPGARLVA